jgi:hypothetical protein
MEILYNDKMVDVDNFVHLSQVDYSSKNREETLGVTFYNGEPLCSNIKANEEEGWVEMYCVDTHVSFKELEKGIYYNFMRDKNGDLMTYKMYGDVIILKVTNFGELILK